MTAHDEELGPDVEAAEVASEVFRRIVEGAWNPGDAVPLDTVMDALGVNRTRARAGSRLLIDKGILAPRARSGAVVTAHEAWRFEDRDVLDWLYRYDPTGAHRLLSEVREAIEPEAARYAADRIGVTDRRTLVRLAADLDTLGSDPHFSDQDAVRERFGAADKAFHTLLLRASGDPVFAAHSAIVERVLDARLARTPQGGQHTSPASGSMFPQRPNTVPLLIHKGIAEAVVTGRRNVAWALSVALLAEFTAGHLVAPTDLLLRWAIHEIPWSARDWARWPAEWRRPPGTRRTSVVVMGVSGAGKSTVGAALAARLGVAFVDADDLHPPANIAKMRSGTPLADDDRWPWLRTVGARLADSRAGIVVACSALRAAYRDVLRAADPDLTVVHLDLPREEAARRAAGREGHFMPAALIDSQFATLEPPAPSPRDLVVDARRPVQEIVELVARHVTSGAG